MNILIYRYFSFDLKNVVLFLKPNLTLKGSFDKTSEGTIDCHPKNKRITVIMNFLSSFKDI